MNSPRATIQPKHLANANLELDAEQRQFGPKPLVANIFDKHYIQQSLDSGQWPLVLYDPPRQVRRHVRSPLAECVLTDFAV